MRGFGEQITSAVDVYLVRVGDLAECQGGRNSVLGPPPLRRKRCFAEIGLCPDNDHESAGSLQKKGIRPESKSEHCRSRLFLHAKRIKNPTRSSKRLISRRLRERARSLCKSTKATVKAVRDIR